MGLDLNYIYGQTPIEEDEKEGLLIQTISIRGELDEFEQYNIEKAVEWTLKNKFKLERILTEDFILEVHYRMLNEVWSWAGKYRIVKTHLFPNGNGQHSRLCGDILISHGLGYPVFTWGGADLGKKGEARKKYLDAIYNADNSKYKPLIEFARS